VGESIIISILLFCTNVFISDYMMLSNQKLSIKSYKMTASLMFEYKIWNNMCVRNPYSTTDYMMVEKM